MPNLAGIVNSVKMMGVRGSSFIVSIDGQKVYISKGLSDEKRLKFKECIRMRGEKAVVVYEEVEIDTVSADSVANIALGMMGYGKTPRRYKEMKEIMTEQDSLTRLLNDVFD